jgi:hypothetical protein
MTAPAVACLFRNPIHRMWAIGRSD